MLEIGIEGRCKGMEDAFMGMETVMRGILSGARGMGMGSMSRLMVRLNKDIMCRGSMKANKIQNRKSLNLI